MTGSLLVGVVQDEAENRAVPAKTAIVIIKCVLLFIGFSPLRLLVFKTVSPGSKIVDRNGQLIV
jgi:hypothetical protein